MIGNQIEQIQFNFDKPVVVAFCGLLGLLKLIVRCFLVEIKVGKEYKLLALTNLATRKNAATTGLSKLPYLRTVNK